MLFDALCAVIIYKYDTEGNVNFIYEFGSL